MSRITKAIFTALAAIPLAFTAAAQTVPDDPLPAKRMVVTMNTDLPGNDLQSLFDTTFEACRMACETLDQCTAFTFNAKNGSCFPKAGAGAPVPFDGAHSARMTPLPAAAQALAADRVRDIAFLGRDTLDEARSLAEQVGWLHPSGQYSVQSMLDSARSARASGDRLNAMRWMGGAVAQSDSASDWAEFARLLIEVESAGSSDRERYRRRAIHAAANAWLRADGVPVRVNALVVLADALELNDRGRDMIPALRLAERLQPREDVTAKLDDAIGKYGFRITDHRVENDRETPRICAEFSEPLAEDGVDYATFLRLPDQSMAVEADGNQVCVTGGTHGERYTVTFREGMPSREGDTLAKDTEIRFYIRDRSPTAFFPGRAYVLPASGEAALPIVTVNADRVELKLRRVIDRNVLRAIQNSYFARQIYQYEDDDFARNVAEEVWTGTGEVSRELNREVTTRLPLGDVLAGLEPGAYALTATIPDQGDEEYLEPATQWFILTDLGMTTMSGADGLHVFVRGLGDAAARPGLAVELLSRSNRVLGTATTDAEGYAHFADGLTNGRDGASPALVTVREGEGDLAFLPLTDPAFDLSDRGVEGREPAGPIDVFLATDRGAYRAGETIHATALARDGVAAGIDGMPLTAILTRPDGVEYSRETAQDAGAGGHVWHLPVAASAPRGTWRLDIKADPAEPALASAEVLVEDFLPERIDFEMTLPDGPITLDDSPSLDIAAAYLFGAPAGNLGIEGEVTLIARTELPDFPGYRFGRHDETLYPATEGFGGATTGDDGTATVAIAFPQVEQLDKPLEARIDVRVLEGSGRPVERRLTRLLAPAAPVIGIRPLFDDVAPEGANAGFELLAIGADMTPVPMNARWTVNRVETRYQWYQQYGNWEWEPFTTRTEIASGTATLGTDPARIEARVDWGNYEVVVEQADGEAAASTDFWAGWYAPADTSTTPDTLELSLDRPGYAIGDTAQVRLVPRYAGTALVTVVTNRLIDMKAVEVTEGENLIDLPVTADWGAGTYVAASVIRPMDVPAGRNPARALGIAWATVEPGDKALTVTFDAPVESDPRGPLEAVVKVAGVTPGETAWVTVAATDVGILNLTGFETPDPQDHYFGQRRLGMDIRDLYGRLIDGLNGDMGRVRSGGDGGARMNMDSPPPTEELVAYFSGPLEIGPDGTAQVSFDIPEFNGTVRLAALAWSKTGVGSAEQDVLVRDPVVVTATLPRFLAPGDSSTLLLEIVHASGPTGRAGLDVSATGVSIGGNPPSGLDLTEQGKATLRIPVSAGEVGDHTIRVALTTPDGRQLTKSLTLPVRDNNPEISTTRRLPLAAGATFTLDADVFAGLKPGTGQAIVSAGPLARLDAPELIATLDRYPYGCTEQVTSKAMPLLYLSSVAESMGIATQPQVDERIGQSITRILTHQASNGAFGLWRASSGDFWLDAYVTDFLSRAKAQGHDVPDLAFRNALDNLRNRVNYAPDFGREINGGGEDVAYALMVLAREGAASMGDLRYYADVKGEDFATPLAAAQVGAALASYGDQTRADAMFRIAGQRMVETEAQDEPQLYRADYGTRLRDAAGLLTLAVEAGSNAVDRATLASRVGAAEGPLSTQESAWTLLAAKALIDDPTVAGITVNGAPVEGPFARVLEPEAAIGMAIRNESAAPTDITLTTIGKPADPVEADGYGYAIDRRYYTMGGEEISPEVVTSGDRFVVVLSIQPFEETGARLIVDDPLPAGFEIDNPNLLRSGDIGALDWLNTAETETTEFRADRFIAALDWRSANGFDLAYIVRAISPGSYHHPAAVVEDMYRPRYRARTADGRVTVAD